MPIYLCQQLKRASFYLLIIIILSLPACKVQFTSDIPPIEYQTIETPSGFGQIKPIVAKPIGREVSQTDLSVFFSQYEDDPIFPADVLEAYLTNPKLMEFQIATIQDLIDHLESSSAPLTSNAFYEMALDRVEDPGTALLVCHNLLKAMARGRSPIPWEIISKDPLIYSVIAKISK